LSVTLIVMFTVVAWLMAMPVGETLADCTALLLLLETI